MTSKIPKLTPRQIANFESKINRSGVCHLWTAAKRTTGYGLFGVGTNHNPVTASRIAYHLYKGEIPDGLWVLHRCDNKLCVNPDHLFLGTAKDNVDDLHQKGLVPLGEKRKNTKVTASAVLQMREIYAKGGTSLKKLAKIYGLCAQTVHELIRRETWKHI